MESEEKRTEELNQKLARAKYLLEELYALVIGECPSLLDDDSGGNGEFALKIEEFLASFEGVKTKAKEGDQEPG
jgi:hypothetical protein